MSANAFEIRRQQRIAQIHARAGVALGAVKMAETLPKEEGVEPNLPDWSETGICVQCGRSHDAQNRRRLLKPSQDLPVEQLREMWPCFYPDTVNGQRTLYRDLAAVGRRVRR